MIIATRNRIASLERTVAALRAQRATATWELIVVDDGSSPPVPEAVLSGVADARLVRGAGRGPAVARNAGLAAATGDVVCFTDDDAEPAAGWVQAAVEFLRTHPGHSGVEGPVDSPPYDPLYAHSIETDAAGRYFTANIAFRRALLERLDGFHEGFPAAHCEDLDLAYRALASGSIGFAEGMRVTHHPRPQTLRQLALRGRAARSEIVLFERHRERFGRAAALPARVFPLVNELTYWRELAHHAGRSPRRLVRAASIGLWHLGAVLEATLRPGAGRAG